MPTTFDSKKLFGTPEFADIVIKVGAREYVCHKIILCNNSDYFKALCSPNGGFKESSQNEIELHDDDPTAVEAVLRYIYGFNYFEIMASVGLSYEASSISASAHMAMIPAARKYLVPALAESALATLDTVIEHIENKLRSDGDATDTLAVLEMLIANKEYHADFGKWRSRLIKTHLPKLFQLERFRNLLESKPWKGALELCKTTVEQGHSGTDGVEEADTETFSQCNGCQMIWRASDVVRACPRCSKKAFKGRLAKVLWLNDVL